MTYYKVLRDGKSCNGGKAEWSLPTKTLNGTWTPGEWMPEIKGKLLVCERGYHICKDAQVIKWLNTEIYEVEYEGKIFEHPDKCVVHKCRLLRKYDQWDERTQRLFACDCAEHTIHFYEDRYPGDKRPREAIEITRQYANGDATKKELAAARVAAWDAAWDAARAAAGAAVWAAEIKWQYAKLLEYIT